MVETIIIAYTQSLMADTCVVSGIHFAGVDRAHNNRGSGVCGYPSDHGLIPYRAADMIDGDGVGWSRNWSRPALVLPKIEKRTRPNDRQVIARVQNVYWKVNIRTLTRSTQQG